MRFKVMFTRHPRKNLQGSNSSNFITHPWPWSHILVLHLALLKTSEDIGRKEDFQTSRMPKIWQRTWGRKLPAQNWTPSGCWQTHASLCWTPSVWEVALKKIVSKDKWCEIKCEKDAIFLPQTKKTTLPVSMMYVSFHITTSDVSKKSEKKWC